MALKTPASNQKIRKVLVPFMAGISLYSIFGGYLFLTLGKAQAHLWFHSFHHPWGDVFFRYFTETANGIIPLVVVHLLLFVRYSWALGFGLSALSMGILVQWLKRSVFDLPRPAGFFEQGILRTIEGVEYAQRFSFPSGHSATAFCMLLFLALVVRKPWVTWVCIVWALLAAYSRVYISMHFIEDTIVGAWIGMITAFLGYYYIVRWADTHPTSKLNGKIWPSAKK
jgi:membrane-associated phospholipid phosphatase